MHIALCGPLDTSAFRELTGLGVSGAPSGLGGMPTTDLAATLLSKGHKVSIATTDPTIDAPVTIIEGDCKIVYCPMRGEPRYRARVRAGDLFAKEIDFLTTALGGFDADIVHAHWTYEFAEAAVRSRLPHVVTMHDLGWDYFLQFRDAYRFMRLVMKYRVMPRVRTLAVVSPFMAPKAWTYGYLGVVDVIPNGVAVPAAQESRRRDLEKPVFVTIGSPERIKNVRASLAAFQIIRAARPDAQLHLFGPGLDAAYVGDAPGIIGHGHTPHAELMAFLETEATVLIHPSRLETFGVIIAEAKARQVPVVAGHRSGGVSYVCDDGVSALVDIDDPQAIAEAAIGLISDPDWYTRAANRSREDIITRFSSEAVADAYLGLYERVLSSVRA